MKHLAILGSTGSIGTSALSVVESFPGRFDAVALAAGHNVARLREQVRTFHPEVVSVADAGAAAALANEFPEVRWVHGAEGLTQVACHPSADVVVGAVVGSAGLAPTLAAIRAGKDIALANKETLVVAGDLVIEAARKHGVRLLPVDSEHNAIHQALRVGPPDGVKRLILTASGGPFRTWSPERIRRATVEDALAHPTWKMGRKISIDSATMMNKALEIIEAHHLFEMPSERISVLIHPQSLVHSFVEYIDGTLIAQLSVNDMRFPILYALAYPDRLPTPFAPLDLASAPALQFEEPDPARFPALDLARAALDEGGEIPAVLNGANEAAVAAFLDRRLPFGAIVEITARVIDHWIPKNRPLASVEQALAADHEARRLAAGLLAKYETPS
ncbi:MAG: 1-deoxy-D-xylulose-5-phosphate reductoisomerase [Acidobacteria bacterium]|nr:1-deoxy-D-xylulose-5-phosphate reductoisomerase [Acidobacteriota bacterium]